MIANNVITKRSLTTNANATLQNALKNHKLAQSE
jgi:hypothetical protein